MTELLLYLENNHCVVVTRGLENNQEEIQRIIKVVRALGFESLMYIPSVSWKFACVDIKIHVFFKEKFKMELSQIKIDELFKVMSSKVRQFIDMVDKNNRR